MKKFLLIIACLLLAVLCFTGCSTKFTSEYGEELVRNGAFEGKDIEGWSVVKGADDSTEATVETTNEASDALETIGKYYLKITADNYYGYRQKVSVEKNNYYCLSANVRVSTDMSDGDGGAYVAIDSDFDAISEVVKEKQTNWKQVKVYFNSGDHTSAIVRFGVGTEEKNADGTAYFDGISLVKVRQSDLPIKEFIPTMSAKSADSYDARYHTNKEGKLYMVLASVLGGLCLFAAYAAFRTLMGKKDAFLSPDSTAAPTSFFKSSGFILIVCELLGFAVRLITVNFVQGGALMNSMVWNSSRLVDDGPAKYYFENKVMTPIGSLYLMWMLGALASPLNLSVGSAGYGVFLKIPAILADLVIIFLIYTLANRKYNQYISAIFAAMYALIPTFFFLSSGYGAYSPIGVLFLLLSLNMLLEKKYVWSIGLYAAATLFSVEVLLVFPLLLVYYVYVFFKSDDYKMQISGALTASVILLYVLAIPFIRSHFTAGNPFVVYKRYCQAFLAYTGFTENAFSIYGLFGLGATKANTASYVFNGILVGLMMLYTAFLFMKSKSRLDVILLAAFTFVFTAVMTSAVDPLLIYYSLGLLLVYGMLTGDRRVLKLFGGFSMTTLLNNGYTMMIGGYFGNGRNSEYICMSASDPMLVIFSIVNVLLLGYFAYVTYSICVKDDVKGVVVVEGNYFKYAWKAMKTFGKETKIFFTETVPALFTKKQTNEEEKDVSEGK